jgi:uncharacterized repeat protein (TIGR03803 family)
MVQATNGYLYGTTDAGGTYGAGTIFQITTEGVLTTLHSFDYDNGAFPGYGSLVLASNGDLYGTTNRGGANCVDTGGCGTVFKITPDGRASTLRSFGFTSGCRPESGLVQATDGNLYGTTSVCGANGGTIFEITPAGALTVLYSPGGSGLVQATDGNFYGFAGGGTDGAGTIFKLSVGLGPFVKTVPSVGSVGAVVTILGTDLTGATSVAFNGIEAAFTVVSPSEISASVPTGATTGKVQAITPSGTLVSNVGFVVQ